MLELLSPDLLFGKQKVFHITDSVLTTIIKTNKRNAVIVYDYSVEVLPQPVKEMLDKLVQACQFKPDETVYLNARFTRGATLGHLQNTYNPRMILIFGEVNVSHNLSKLKKNFAYELSGVKIVNTESLETLAKNDAAKKALWGVLKKMLGI